MHGIFIVVNKHILENNGISSEKEAYTEIARKLKKAGFEMIYPNFYVLDNHENPLAKVYEAIKMLYGTEWFRKCVAIAKVFKLDDFSDLLDIFDYYRQE